MSERHRVLAVDDNPRNLVILEKVLGTAYDVVTAGSGEEALKVADAVRPDLILLDINMPGMDGYETCRRLRAHPQMGRPKIIIVSARGLLRERLDGYAVGADDYVTKPFNQDELLAKVRVYLELKSVQEIDQLRRSLITLLRHETQTPLTAILAAVELLRSESVRPGENATFLRIISEASERLSILIDRAVLLSTLRAREVSVTLSPIPYSVAVDRVKASRASAAAVKRVSVHFIPGDDPLFDLDPRFAEYVMGSLLDDTIEACHEGGEVTSWVETAGDWVTIHVKDNGDGRGERFSRLAFEPFSVDDVDHHHRGDGLPLAIAREMVIVHGGTIDVESGGSGTTFRLRLPLSGKGTRSRVEGREGVGSKPERFGTDAEAAA